MNEHPSDKRHWPTVLLVLIATAALAVCLLLAGYLYLPELVTGRLPVAQVRRLGFADFKGRVGRIGPFQATAGPFVFGHADHPALSIHSIAIDYAPAELRRKTIRCIRISDVTVNGDLGPDGLTFPGLNRGAPARTAPVAQAGPDAGLPLAGIKVKEMAIRGGMLNLTWDGATYKIPFEADVKSGEKDAATLGAYVRLYLRDQLLTLAVQADVDGRQARVSLDGAAIAMDRFADLIHRVAGLDATGKVTVESNAQLTWAPLAISDVNLRLTWHSGRLAYASAVVEPGPEGTPATLSAVSADTRTWRITARGAQLQTPAPVAIKVLSATADVANGLLSVAGDAEMTLLPWSIQRPTPVSLKAGAFLPVTFDVSRKDTGEWTAGFGTKGNHPDRGADPLDITLAGAHIHGGPPRFSLTAAGDGQGGRADWRLDMKEIRATHAGTTLTSPSVEASGELRFKDESHDPAWTGYARMRLASPTLDGKGMAGRLDAVTLSARFGRQGRHLPVVDARLQGTNGRFHHRDSGLRLSGGHLDLPFRSDTGAAFSQGTFSLGRIDHRQRTIGSLTGRITQQKDAYVFAATHASGLFPGMTATLAGSVQTNAPRFGNADFNVEIPPYELPAGSNLGQFLSAANGITLSGTIAATGKASLDSKGFNGDIEVAVKGGELHMAQKKIAVARIDATLHFPELPRIRSGPAQPIRFARAAMGGIVIDGGRFDVQVESADTLFVEKGRLNWCDGKVDAQALRITAGKQDYQVSLYCQRLGLSRILEQLGAVNARGSGTVNGRIPIAYSNGRIRFDDGFLFSTPGEPGQILLTGTDMLTRGIPAGTPQFAQVELAREALKDYAYTWAKLGLTSEGEDLVMRLQFDGKPANPLPFVYKKEIGGFVRVEAGAQGSLFQGIGLDVNLRLPLDQLLQYKGIVDRIE